jgi:hypothetical protein
MSGIATIAPAPTGALPTADNPPTEIRIELAGAPQGKGRGKKKASDEQIARAYAELVTTRPNASWKSGWREIGGISKYYRSSWEANYARYLQWLKERGQIAKWEHEPQTFWFIAIQRGARSYLPDFRVTEKNGSVSYHEVKGWMDDRSITKIKRMAKYHPQVKLVVVTAKAYRKIAAAMAPMLPGWE